ncbi:hypothetical protein JTE90_008262 [Oedothorax gibbosus]|uniref:Uncharacterized protein n=1 Tax=Oedothorax gibbosus TaxID=931172 RepID=A0AAV6UH19_9ARAC|nr:hypothetical protein JTE90_008262 [Oedothorax gibbosus]
MSFTVKNCISEMPTRNKKFKIFEIAKDDILAKKYLSAVFLAIKKYVSSIKFSTFKDNYAIVYEIDADHLHDLYNQFRDQLFLRLNEMAYEVFTVCESSFLLSPMNKIIWKNINDKKRNRNVPNAVARHKEKKNAIQKLKSILNGLKSANEETILEISRNHEQILTLGSNIQRLNQEIMIALDSLYTI